MLTKGRLNLIAVFSLITLVSVGFSSFSITNSQAKEVFGGFGVDEVISNDQFVKVTNTSCFRYYNTGFLSDDEETYNEIVDTGYITIDMTIDAVEVRKLYGHVDSLVVDLLLRYSDSIHYGDYAIFDNCTITSNGYTVETNYTPSSPTRHNAKVEVTGLATCGDSLSFSVVYAFTISEEEFTSKTYSFLKGNDFTLIANV